jgi:hypothetical protein
MRSRNSVFFREGFRFESAKRHWRKLHGGELLPAMGSSLQRPVNPAVDDFRR